MTSINFMVESGTFQNYMEDKSQNNSTVETIVFIFFKNVFGGKK